MQLYTKTFSLKNFSDRFKPRVHLKIFYSYTTVQNFGVWKISFSFYLFTYLFKAAVRNP